MVREFAHPVDGLGVISYVAKSYLLLLVNSGAKKSYLSKLKQEDFHGL